jgi:hypothetical protein
MGVLSHQSNPTPVCNISLKCRASLVAETAALISASHVGVATVLPSTLVHETETGPPST